MAQARARGESQITNRKTSVKVTVEESDIRLFDENGIAVSLEEKRHEL